MKVNKIFHICQKTDWEKAKKDGAYSPPSIETEGFIHFSTEEQVAKTLNSFYKNLPDLILLHTLVEKIVPNLKWEDSAGDVFPHVYGPINLEAVLEVEVLKPGKTGLYTYPQ